MALSFPALDAAAAADFAGQQALLGQRQSQAELELRQQQIATAKINNQLQQQALQNKTAMSQWLQSEQALQEEPTTNATGLAKLYGRASQQALLRGDFDGAQEMDRLAKGQLDIAEKEGKTLEEARVRKAEALSTAAQDVLADPSPENHKKLVDAALASGVNPADIPLPSDPKYKAFATQSAMAPLTGQKRLDYLEKVREHQEQERQRKQAEEDRHQERVEAQKDRAAARESLTEYHKESLAIRNQLAQSIIEARKEKQAAGGEIRRRNTIAAVNYANETVRGLDLVGTMAKNQTGSIFAHLSSPDTLLNAVRNMSGNEQTPEIQQIYQTATKGLGLEIAQLATAGSGRSANKDVIKEMSDMVEAKPGDKDLEIMFKLVNAADFVRERLKAVPRSPDPEIQKTREEAEKRLEKYPSPAQVIEAATKKGIKLGTIKKMKSLRQSITDTLNRQEAAAPPPDIQDLLNLYPAK